jgi:hypothetical protein
LPPLYAATDALLDARAINDAADLWQALGNSRPGGITHPDFEPPRIGHGFDWRLAEVAGITHVALEAPGHRIRFSGRQPESCELLRQVLGGLRAGTAYALHWDGRTQGVAAPTGITWQIAGRAGEVNGSEDWSTGRLVFTPDSDQAVLVLAYRRPEGQVRTEGSLDLKRVTISSPE